VRLPRVTFTPVAGAAAAGSPCHRQTPTAAPAAATRTANTARRLVAPERVFDFCVTSCLLEVV
jgi:acyl-CoA reductase-like NAD-dependent aldehyde dehydrogenase